MQYNITISYQYRNEIGYSFNTVNAQRKVVELDGKKRENFDLLDYFIADYGIVLKNAEKVMAMDSLVIAKKLVDINVTRDEILEITLVFKHKNLYVIKKYLHKFNY